MKKKFFFGTAIVLAVSLSFASANYTPVTWLYIANECDWQQRVNPNNYIPSWASCYPGETHFCKIVANSSSAGKPVIINPSPLYNGLVNNQDILPQPVPGYIYLRD